MNNEIGDIKKWDELTPEEKEFSRIATEEFEKAAKEGKLIILTPNFSKQVLDFYEKVYAGLPERFPAFAKADTNKDGRIDGPEFAAVMKDFYSPVTLAGLSMTLDCANPNQGRGPVSAEDATRDANRFLAMLHKKEPGYGATEYVAWMTSVYPVDREFGAGTAKAMHERLPALLKEVDSKILTQYEQSVDEGKLGELPTQVLPLTPADLCAGLSVAKR